MLDISDRKQLFIDHRFIESSESTSLTVNPAVKRPGAAVRIARVRRSPDPMIRCGDSPQ